jgi:hypothetical protein
MKNIWVVLYLGSFKGMKSEGQHAYIKMICMSIHLDLDPTALMGRLI